MKRIFLLLVLCSPAWASWSFVQGPATDINNGCTGTTCAVTVSSTGLHHLLVAGVTVNTNTSITISSVTAGACNATWTHAANTAVSFAGNGSSDIYYCTDATSGNTSITVTVSGAGWSGGGGAAIWEFSSSLGTIAIDSGATPSGNVNDSSACTSCAGVALTLSGNNDAIVAMSICVNGCTAVSGTGYTFETSVSGQGYARGLSSGTQTAPATWTQTSGTLKANAAAFQETGAGTNHQQFPRAY